MSKKNSILILIFLFIISLTFAQNNNQRRKVRVGCMNHHHFIQQKDDGTFEGYAVEYMQELIKYTNWEVEYVVPHW